MNAPATIPELFLRKFQQPIAQCIGKISGDQCKWLSSGEFCQELLLRIEHLNSLESRHKNVAILGDTSLPWHLCDLSLLLSGRVVTPIYPTLSAEEIHFILTDSQATLLLVSDEKLYAKVKGQLPSGIQVLSFESAIDGLESLGIQGEKLSQNHVEAYEALKALCAGVKPEDLASIVYTSGTTGRPKGVMITHEGIATMLLNVHDTFKGRLTEDDLNLVFLPLSHVLGRCDSHLHLVFPLKTIYSRGFNFLSKDLMIAKPTIMISVPRVFEKIYEGVFLKLKSMGLVKRTVFNFAEKVSKKYFKQHRADKIPDLSLSLLREASYKAVYKNIYQQMGGRIRFFVSGGAPLGTEVYRFFERAGITILEGYGLTETIAPCCLNPIRKPIESTVGVPLGEVEIKLSSEQEIMVKSKALFTGYWNLPEETKHVLVDGWFYTGDIGTWTVDGHLKITDRKKDIIITSGGKNIAPQKIENLLLSNPYLSQALVIGDRRKYISALIVPNYDAIRKEAEKLGLPLGLTAAELIERSEVISLVEKFVTEANKELSHFETIKRFHLLSNEFTVENGQLTPSLKAKRKVIEKTYNAEIDAMYN